MEQELRVTSVLECLKWEGSKMYLATSYHVIWRLDKFHAFPQVNEKESNQSESCRRKR